MKNNILLFVIMISIFLSCDTLFTQPPGEKFQERMGPERIEKFKMIRLIEVLDLPEESAVRFTVKANEHEKLLRDLRKMQAEMQEKLDEYLKKAEEAAKNKVQYEKKLKELQKQLDQFEENRGKMLDEEKRFLKELKELLNSEQMAKYYLFQRDFEKELREAMKRLRKDMPRHRMREKE
jgi:chromosome segregation ATPase